jgi:hypothetical protein
MRSEKIIERQESRLVLESFEVSISISFLGQGFAETFSSIAGINPLAPKNCISHANSLTNCSDVDFSRNNDE